MTAQGVNLLQFLQGTKQFIIPIYQRTYSWNYKQCNQLWNDIIRVAKEDELPAHFIGSIVYIEQGLYSVSSVPQLLVIDGQQRLTTISLLLCAFREFLGNGDNTNLSPQKINNYYLKNSEEEGELSYKLILTRGDKDVFKGVINNIDQNSSDVSAPRITENYNFFKSQFENMDLTAEEFFKGLQKLVIVDISLDRNHDNPQLIFESLNSTGLELSQADLIRNFILMGMEPTDQNELYENYWYKMEQDFGQLGYAERFDDFMRDYLTLKSASGTISRINEVYEDFKKLTLNKNIQETIDVVKDIAKYSRYYTCMVFNKEENKSLLAAFNDLQNLRVDVVYPLLLEVYDDYKKDLTSVNDFLEILGLVESYVFRRAVVGIPTNSLNKTFSTFSRKLDKTNYMESFKAQFLLQDSYRRFPNDEEFKREFVLKDVYNFRNRNYLLKKLENFERKEPVIIDDYTIEHIMPQNDKVSTNWKNELGENWKEIHEKYLHTIGNLTLTGYNSELSDRSFAEKKIMKGGFADSPIRLNSDLAKLSTWNENEIVRRANKLALKAVTLWHFPDLPLEKIEKYKQIDESDNETYTIDHFEDFSNEHLLELFNALRKRILNLDPGISEVFLKKYIAYKTYTNFVDVKTLKDKLKVVINLEFAEINDPKGIARDVSGVGHRGNGDVEVSYDDLNELDYIMFLVQQSYYKYSDQT